jgi:large subunit ribosomal protein L14e
MQVGRVCLVNFGKDTGKLVTVVDIIDQSRALVDGPTTGFARQSIPFKRLSLTPLLIPQVGRGCRTGTLTKKLKQFNVEGQFATTGWGKKAARDAIRADLTDFQRFQVQVLKKKKAIVINKKLGALKAAKKN